MPVMTSRQIMIMIFFCKGERERGGVSLCHKAERWKAITFWGQSYWPILVYKSTVAARCESLVYAAKQATLLCFKIMASG